MHVWHVGPNFHQFVINEQEGHDRRHDEQRAVHLRARQLVWREVLIDRADLLRRSGGQVEGVRGDGLPGARVLLANHQPWLNVRDVPEVIRERPGLAGSSARPDDLRSQAPVFC
jgi:hypothetical protein